jgi:hypothetical protein
MQAITKMSYADLPCVIREKVEIGFSIAMEESSQHLVFFQGYRDALSAMQSGSIEVDYQSDDEDAGVKVAWRMDESSSKKFTDRLDDESQEQYKTGFFLAHGWATACLRGGLNLFIER